MTGKKNRQLILIGVLTGAAVLVGTLFYFLPDKEEVPEVVRRFGEHIPDAPPGRYSAHRVDVVDPANGIKIPMFFTALQWKMLNQLALVENKEVDMVIAEIALERFQNGL
jgi:hypothetical protein